MCGAGCGCEGEGFFSAKATDATTIISNIHANESWPIRIYRAHLWAGMSRGSALEKSEAPLGW
jgi:hypothetical protein